MTPRRLTRRLAALLAAALLAALAVPAAAVDTQRRETPHWQTAQPEMPQPGVSAQPTGDPPLEAFQSVGPRAGWVLLGQRLYWTADDGATWADITPAGLGAARLSDRIGAVHFARAARGWLIALAGAPATDPAYTLWATADGGATWQPQALDLFAPGETAALVGALYLEFLDERTGWLVVKQATGSAFSLGTLFRTSDGGDTWTRHALPVGGAVHFTSALEGWLRDERVSEDIYLTRDGGATWALAEAGAAQALPPIPEGLAAVSMADGAHGWARQDEGNCAGGACTTTVRLLRTADGGAAWRPLPLPGGRAALTESFALPAAPEGGGAAAQAAGDFVHTFHGQGFDGCTGVHSGPLGSMQTWWDHSPYKVRNLYMGGAAGFPCGSPLTRDYIQVMAQQGWLFIPTWVGPQAACFGGSRRMSLDPALAYQQGVIEAHLALDRAIVLGLAQPDGSGTVLYYDLESYPGGSDFNGACRTAARAFINGWTKTVRDHGSTVGVYGSPCSSYLTDFVAGPHIPDAVWIAFWTEPAYTNAVTVTNLPCIDNSFWVNNQRLRQYTGGHNETWGGITLNIDSNVLAGPVSTVVGACQPGFQQAAWYAYPNYAGACALRSTGVYTTVESLGIPNDSMSSVRLGPGARVTLCEHIALGGVCSELTSDAPHLGAHPVGDNQVSSAQVHTVTLTLPPNRLWFPVVHQYPVISSLLPNGGFEAGPVVWGLSSANGRSLIVPANELAPTNHSTHSGQWAAWLGGVFTETAAMAQTVLVRPQAPFLAYWQWVDSDETGCFYDVASIWVNGNVVEAYGLCSALETQTWVRRAVDLSAFAGQVVQLRIQVTTDGSLNSSLFLDDVAFESGP